MQRMTAAMMIALAPCLFVTSNRAATPQPHSAFSIVLRIADSSPQSGGSVVTIKFGAVESTVLSSVDDSGTDLSNCIETWREEARDALFKRLRMA